MGLWCKIIWPHCNRITLEKMENMEPADITMQITSFKLLKMLSAIPHFWSAMTFVEDPQDTTNCYRVILHQPSLEASVCIISIMSTGIYLSDCDVRSWLLPRRRRIQTQQDRVLWFECLNILLPGKKESRFKKLHSLDAKKICRDLDIRIYSQDIYFYIAQVIINPFPQT